MFSSVDIEEELVKTRQKHAQGIYNLKKQVDEAKAQNGSADEFIVKRLRSAPKPGRLQIESTVLDKNKVFSKDDIRSLCIHYRYRFLDGKFFKMKDLTPEASATIKSIEKELGSEIGQVKVVSTYKNFRSGDIDNKSLLFAQIDEDNFYLVHKSTGSVSGFKKALAFPMRSIWALLLCLIIICLPFMFILPAILFKTPEEVQYYQTFYMAAFCITTVFVAVFGGFSFYKSFSRANWNSYYLN